MRKQGKPVRRSLADHPIAAIIIILAAIVSIIIFVTGREHLAEFFTPTSTTATASPTVAITHPIPNQGVELTLQEGTQNGFFSIRGSSSQVSTDPSLRLGILARVTKPDSQGWWIQPEVREIDRNTGDWEAVVYSGDNNYPREVGDSIDIVAVVVDSTTNLTNGISVGHPTDLNPVAMSNRVTVRIDGIVSYQQIHSAQLISKDTDTSYR